MTDRQTGRSPAARIRRPAVVMLALAAAGLAGAAAAPAGAAGPRAVAATHSCHVPGYPGLGYFTSLKVSGTSCRTGTKVTLDYYKCRTRRGKAGACHSTVDGYHCRERRNTIPTEIEARVTCTRGSATVVHTYQQDL